LLRTYIGGCRQSRRTKYISKFSDKNRIVRLFCYFLAGVRRGPLSPLFSPECDTLTHSISVIQSFLVSAIQLISYSHSLFPSFSYCQTVIPRFGLSISVIQSFLVFVFHLVSYSHSSFSFLISVIQSFLVLVFQLVSAIQLVSYSHSSFSFFNLCYTVIPRFCFSFSVMLFLISAIQLVSYSHSSFPSFN
jgi:hypothetical protein